MHNMVRGRVISWLIGCSVTRNAQYGQRPGFSVMAKKKIVIVTSNAHADQRFSGLVISISLTMNEKINKQN